MGIYTENDRHYSGAGVIVIEDYRNSDKSVTPCILVARNRASQKVSDFGGGYAKKHKMIEVTAFEELLEESRNLINVGPDILKQSEQFDILKKDDYYRVYVIKGQNVATKYFRENMEIIDSDPDSKRHWKETDGIHHVPIDNIPFDILTERGRKFVKDIHGNDIELQMRLRKALFAGKDIIMRVLGTEPIFSRDDLVITEESNNEWLNGTNTFIASA